MLKFLSIFSLIFAIFILGIWIQIKYSLIRNYNLDFKNDEPFDNFRYFNDLDEIEEKNKCNPFIIGPKQSDLIEMISPIIFSCNSPMKRWANFTNGKLIISEKLIEKRKKENNQNFTCIYTEILAGDELSNGTIIVKSSKNEIIIEPGVSTKIPLEQFVVFCRDPSGNHFYNKTFFNFIPKSKHLLSETTGKMNGLMIFSISGMSHNQAMRHLKQSLKFASNNKFHSFSMFNQESTENWKNSMKSFGEFEKIWDSVKNIDGCRSFLHTDSPEFSKMFGKDFDYHSNLYNYFNRQYLGHVDNCISDGSVTVEDSVTLWINFTKYFQSYSCHFSLLHLTEIASPEDGKLVNLDEILNISLEELLEKRIYENTTIVILSDGGTEKSSISNTESGNIESKYGLFLIRLADNFRKRYPEKANNFRKNVDRLITNTDLYKSLHFIINKWNNSENLNPKSSLFDTEITSERTCKQAEISENSCICSKKVIIENEKKKEIMNELMKIVKRELSEFKCISEINLISDGLEFKNYGTIYFFEFRGFLITERIKISDNEGFSNSTTLVFNGKARFSMEEKLNLELRQPLFLDSNYNNEITDRISDRCFHKIIKNFDKTS